MTDTTERAKRVQDIVEALQSEVASHQPAGSAATTDPLAAVRERQWVNSHLPIGWPVMPPGLANKLRAYCQKAVRRLLRWYIDPLVDQQNRANAAVSEALRWLAERDGAIERQLQAQISANYEHLRHHAQQLAESAEQRHTVQQEWAAVRAALEALSQADRENSRQAIEQLRLRLQRLENWQRLKRGEGQPPAAAAEPVAFDYYLLGIRYRGQEQLAERLSDYDDLFQALADAQARGTQPTLPVLDAGCGRGDLIGHLLSLGLPAYGIEMDADAARAAKASGYDVRLEDLLDHLAGLPDASLGAITLIQVIEHLDLAALLRLFTLSAKKLAPGGMIIAETINPHCLEAVTRYYLMDPSHRSLLPAPLTQMLLEQCGLGECQTRYLRPVPAPVRLEPVPLTDQREATPALERNLSRLNDILYGAQDYAVIGYRALDGEL
jgi:O-antigen chain-terminating methyltransferase